jgi:phytoene dehydrogenase-like protein
MFDAVVVGAGPNGLAAAIELARAGRSVLVLEAEPEIGGGMRSAELTLPGFVHDVCSTVHPLGIASPFFRGLDLPARGVAWVQPPIPLAHPFDDGTAATLERSTVLTGASLDPPDREAWAELMDPFVERWQPFLDDSLGPLQWPGHPLLLGRFGLKALRSAVGLAQGRFRGARGRALFGGLAAHAILPLTTRPTAAFGLMLGITGHAVGWPVVRGGSARLAEAMAAELRALGGAIRTGVRVRSLADLPPHRAAFLDVTPSQFLALAGDRLPRRYARRLQRYRYGPGVFKMDWALSAPIPWTAAECRRAGTVHLGPTLEDMTVAEQAAWDGRHPERPFLLVVQPTLFDPDRAPPGQHTAWAYCHVPHGSLQDMSGRMESQIERFAPGFRDVVLARSAWNTADFERHNPNIVGGDINGGAQDLRQLFTRPTLRLRPYRTPLKGVYLCSASTPPGGGVHGMGGYFAVRTALKDGY